jgi:hypothetical protein
MPLQFVWFEEKSGGADAGCALMCEADKTAIRSAKPAPKRS